MFNRKIDGRRFSGLYLNLNTIVCSSAMARCRAADTASLATWFLFGKLTGVVTLFGFGEKRCRKNLPLAVTYQSLCLILNPDTGDSPRAMRFAHSKRRFANLTSPPTPTVTRIQD